MSSRFSCFKERLSSALNIPLYVTALLSISVALGCAGKKIAPASPTDLSVPDELAKAFEVKDLPSEGYVTHAASPIKPASEVQAPANASKSTMATKKTRAKKTKKTDPVVTAANGFVIPLRRPKADPIWVGEKIFMDVTWLATKAGEFQLEVLPHKEINGRKVYHLKGTARTSDLFAMVYKAEDWVETFIDYEGWFPYKFTLHGNESKHIRNHLELFDHSARKQYVHIHDNRLAKKEIHEKKGYQDLTPLSQDSLSSLHYVRTFDLPNGHVIRFPMTTGGKQVEAQLTVLGREEVKTRMGYIKAIKTKVETRLNGVLRQKGDSFIWFSDDDRKFPLKFEAKVRIGWISGVARQIEPGQRPEEPKIIAPQPTPKKGTVSGNPASGASTRSQAPAEAVSGIGKASFSASSKATPKPKPWFREMIQSAEDAEKKKK